MINIRPQLGAYSQYYKVRIEYIYYEVIGRSDMTETVKHSIRYDKIMECLEEKNYVLRKEDIIYLLKNDGAHFFEDSLRIYDESEDNYFQLPDDWEVVIDQSEPFFLFSFWVKSINPNFRRKIDDMSDDIKGLKQELTGKIETVEAELKTNFEKVFGEIDKLVLKSQVLFHQLAKLYEKQVVPNNEVHSPLENQMHFLDLENSVENLVNSKENSVRHMSRISAPETVSSKDHQNHLERVGSQRQDLTLNLRGVDIALMYSEPLVKRDDLGIVSLGDPVDYEEECVKVLDILRKKEKRINIYFEIATLRHLVNVLSLSPTVLHIICHGDFNKKKNQFFLCFEENGELVELYSEDLKKKLQTINFSTQLVFINACHSEEVARVFMEAGVPCVVAVHSELKIEDTVAQIFSESFYWQLFEGKPIEDAFRNATAAISGNVVYTCCCAHSHKSNCEWYKLAKEEGFEKAHYLHTPTCSDCAWKFGNKFFHKENCMWAIDFLTELCKLEDFPQGNFHICCCSPELEHNEAMKFKLISKEDKFKQQMLFRYRESGEVAISSTHSCVDPKFSIPKMNGRNKELYEIFKALREKEKRIVNLYGPGGVGKTTLAKQVANYMVERGFFREKVCILLLEKTPGITHFESSLFKELPGCYDLKSFCESIKVGRMLFILEKCDKLINEHYDQFSKDIAYIMEHASNVKFLLITNEKQELNLGESYVPMKELRKIDAAKLLSKNAYPYLSWNERNVYTLAEHPIFGLIPLTPQGIWSITEKLKNNKVLDEIEMDIIMEKEKYDGKTEENRRMDETIRKTLWDIQETHPEAYSLLIFICLFPSGLSYQDLEELSLHGKISSNWKEVLFYFLRSKAFSSKSQYELGEAEFPEVYQGRRERGESRDSGGLKNRKIDRSDFKPDSYFWINISKEPIDHEIWFSPTQFIIRHVEKYLYNEILEQNFKKLEYLSMLATGLIERIKSNHDYIEKLLEASAVCTYGIWQPPTSQILQVKYLKNPGFDFDKLKRLFAAHEPNFFSCLEPKPLDSLPKEENGKMLNAIIDIMEIICLAIPTLFKLISVKESGAMEVARKAEQLLKQFETSSFRTHVIKIKLNLFVTSLYLGTKTDISENFFLAKILLNSIQDHEEKLRDTEFGPFILSEILFTKAVYYYKGFKKNCIKSKEFTNKYSVYEEINNLLKKAQALLEPDLKKSGRFRVAKAKITLMQAKARQNKRNFEKKQLDDMKDALIAFKEYKSLRLLMKANYLYACLRLELQRSAIGVKMPDTSIANVRRTTGKLVEIKNIYLAGTALEIAKKIKSNLYEGKIKRKIDEINKEIRHTYFNVIIIMRSAPIVDIKPGKAGHSENSNSNSGAQILPSGFPTRVASSFKNTVTNALTQSNKVLCLKFEVLTKKELIDSLINGCRVLQLTCSYSEQNCFCVEGPYGVIERISFEELQDIFSSKVTPDGTSTLASTVKNLSRNQFEENSLATRDVGRNMRSSNTHIGGSTAISERRRESTNRGIDIYNNITLKTGREPDAKNFAAQLESKLVDVLILAVKNNRKLVDLFIGLRIPHIITFEFLSNEFNFRHKTYEDECVEQFSIYFYKELVAQKSIQDAFDIASNKIFDYLGEKYFDGKPRGHVTRIIGTGPVLFPQDADHSEVLFGPGRFPLVSGKLDDISTTRYPTNIEKILVPYTGRNRDLYEVMKKVTEHRGFLKVTGPPGIGKTAFVLQMGYHILSRNVFPDGIFYIPLKKLKYRQGSDYQMKDLLKETLGLDAQLGFQSFFKSKNMLLIFDDFDLFYKKEIDFPRLVFLTLKECGIPSIIVTSTSGIPNEGQPKGKRKQKAVAAYSHHKKEIDGELIDKKDKNFKWKLKPLSEEELALILQSLVKTESYKDFMSLEELKKCPQVRHAQGNPKYIIEKLLEKKIEVQKNVLAVNPNYEKALHFEDEYILAHSVTTISTPSLSLGRRTSSNISLSRLPSSIAGGEQIPQGIQIQQSPRPSPQARIRQQKSGRSDEATQLQNLHKSKSFKSEKKNKSKKGLNRTFDSKNEPMKKRGQKRAKKTQGKQKKEPFEITLNQSIRSTGSADNNRKEVGSQTIIDEKVEEEKSKGEPLERIESNILNYTFDKSPVESIYDLDNIEQDHNEENADEQEEEDHDMDEEDEENEEDEDDDDNYEDEEEDEDNEDEGEDNNDGYEEPDEEEEKKLEEHEGRRKGSEDDDDEDLGLNGQPPRWEFGSVISNVEEGSFAEEASQNKRLRRLGRTRLKRKMKRGLKGVKQRNAILEM